MRPLGSTQGHTTIFELAQLIMVIDVLYVVRVLIYPLFFLIICLFFHLFIYSFINFDF